MALNANQSEYTTDEICKAAIERYGERHQEDIAIEECSELIQAISHKHRGRPHNIIEEIADVLIVLHQLILINDCENEVEEMVKYKASRLLGDLLGKNEQNTNEET